MGIEAIISIFFGPVLDWNVDDSGNPKDFRYGVERVSDAFIYNVRTIWPVFAAIVGWTLSLWVTVGPNDSVRPLESSQKSRAYNQTVGRDKRS